MIESTKKTIVRTVTGSLSAITVFIVLLMHNSWGDDRYVLKEDARIQAIAELDAQLAIKDTEILFAEDEREKEKLKAIKAIYERRKEALREEAKDK